MSNLPVNTVKVDNRKCVYITVVPKSFKFLLLPTDSVFLDHVVYCYTSCTRQSTVGREGLEHDERSEERVRQHIL
jgi:hypothetical protein